MKRKDSINELIYHKLHSKQMPYHGGHYGNSLLWGNFAALDTLYVNNGLARVIVSAPVEDALRAGFSLKEGEKPLEANNAIQSILEDLCVEAVFSKALSWDRLYGGAAVLMLANDGGTLRDPLREENLKYIERLEVFDPGDIVFINDNYYNDPMDKNYGKPEFYTLINEYGHTFDVHESRLLIFTGGFLPNRLKVERQGWGAGVLEQVSERLSHYDEALCLAIQALRKLSQGVMKLANMDSLMMSDEGQKQVQERLDLIDLYRSLDNTLALDKEDEYDLKNLSLTGIKDIIEQMQFALSAVTNIPATVLFGRAPTGMNSTGESDMENYYNMVRRIQQRALKPQLSRLVWLVGKSKDYELNMPEVYKLEFNPLWNPTAKEDAETRKINADASKEQAEAAKIYHDLGVLDAKEIRDTIEETSEYLIDRSLDDTLSAPVEEE